MSDHTEKTTNLITMSNQVQRSQALRVWPLYSLELVLGEWSLSLPNWTDLGLLLPQRAVEMVANQSDADVQLQEWALFQGELLAIANWLPHEWQLSLCVKFRRQPVGIQRLLFKAAENAITTDSWIAECHRRQGHGSSARIIALDFAFNWLGVQYAKSQTLANNIASNALNQRLGYQIVSAISFFGAESPEYEWRLPLEVWVAQSHGRTQVLGLTDECKRLLGIKKLW